MRDSKLHIDGTDFDKLIDMHNAEYVEEVQEIDEVREHFKCDGWEEIRYKTGPGLMEQIKESSTTHYYTAYTNEKMLGVFDSLMASTTVCVGKSDSVMAAGLALMAHKESK